MNDIMASQGIGINYKFLIDNVSNPIFTADEAGEIIYLNNVAKSLGATSGNKIWRELLATDNVEDIHSFNNKLKNNNTLVVNTPPHAGLSPSFEVYVKAVNEDNQSVNYLYTLSPTPNNSGKNIVTDQHIAAIPADINELASFEFHNQMVEEIEDYAILMLDHKGTIINWNKGAQNIKGYTAGEIIGCNFEIFYSEKDRELSLPKKLLTEAEDNGKTKSEGWRLRKDGTCFWAHVVITAVHDKNGSVIGFTKVTRDLTEKKIAEEQREQQSRDIETKNRQLEEFAYITSHDLQEPIRKIQTFTQLIKQHISDRHYTENYLHKISVASVRMSMLIKDILEYAHLLQKNGDLQKTDLNAVLEGVREDLELLIAERHVELRALNVLPVLPAVRVHMQQLFTNLINNAIKFSANNPIIEISSHVLTIEVGREHLLPGNYNCLTFKDNGIGFEQKYAEEIFKPFKRLTSHAKGTGIGLALCHKIIENHGGSIEVSSQPGVGTTFTVYLPS